MFQLLHAYLIENRSLYILGIGHLEFIRQPAIYDVANQVLQPPYTAVRFTGAKSEQPIHLYDFLASRLEITAAAAAKLYEDFCNSLNAELISVKTVEWKHLGAFSKAENGEISFMPGEALSTVSQPVSAVRIIRQGTAHNVLVGDREATNTQMQDYFTEQVLEKPVARWWIAPLIIGLAAMALIILKKMNYL